MGTLLAGTRPTDRHFHHFNIRVFPLENLVKNLVMVYSFTGYLKVIQILLACRLGHWLSYFVGE